MSAFVLKLATDNAAFEEGDGVFEIARILRKVAEHVEFGDMDGPCMDVNGNKVGTWRITP